MAHDVATEIQGGVGALVKMFVDFAVELAEFEMTSSASLVHKVNTQVNVLGALTATRRSSDQAMHVSLSAKTQVGAV